MKGYKNFFTAFAPKDVSEGEEIPQPAKMLGASIADGRYNGVSDGSAGLLRGQYDDDDSMSVDPLCDFSTDPFGLVGAADVASSSGDSGGDSE